MNGTEQFPLMSVLCPVPSASRHPIKLSPSKFLPRLTGKKILWRLGRWRGKVRCGEWGVLSVGVPWRSSSMSVLCMKIQQYVIGGVAPCKLACVLKIAWRSRPAVCPEMKDASWRGDVRRGDLGVLGVGVPWRSSLMSVL